MASFNLNRVSLGFREPQKQVSLVLGTFIAMEAVLAVMAPIDASQKLSLLLYTFIGDLIGIGLYLCLRSSLIKQSFSFFKDSNKTDPYVKTSNEANDAELVAILKKVENL